MSGVLVKGTGDPTRRERGREPIEVLFFQKKRKRENRGSKRGGRRKERILINEFDSRFKMIISKVLKDGRETP